MTTATSSARTSAPPGPTQAHDVALFQSGISEYRTEKTNKGTTKVSGLRVFRSGTFKDSWGDPHTFESEHMTQMVSNFNSLRNKGALPNVPVREGHRGLFGSGGTVKGYVTDLYTQSGTLPDGTIQTFLHADFELTEPDAADKLERGTYRARSAEIGMYETNDEALYYPVFMGFAFVDIPAVEHLYNREQRSFILLEEKDVTTPAAPVVPTPVSFTQSSSSSQAPPQGQSSEHGTGQTQTQTPPAAASAAGPPSSPQQGGYVSPTSIPVFRVNGNETSDSASVQRHIDGLELFRKETIESGRKEFVKKLATDGRILASKIDEVEEFALSLDDASFSAWRQTMDAVVPSSVVSKVDSGVTDPTGQQSNHNKNPVDDQIEILQGVVDGLKVAGMSQDQIGKTESYQKLQALKTQRNAA